MLEEAGARVFMYCEYENHSFWSCCSALLEWDCWVSWSGDGERGTWIDSLFRSADWWMSVEVECGICALLDRGGVGSGGGASSSSDESSLMTIGVDGQVS